MSDNPNIKYGRILESVHITGYSMERACRELEQLIDSNQWMAVGDGFTDIDDFLRSIDMSQGGKYRIAVEDRKRLAKKLEELSASQRATAGALGVTNATVSRDLNPQRQGVTHVTKKPEKGPVEDDFVTHVTPAPKPTRPLSGEDAAKLVSEAAEVGSKKAKVDLYTHDEEWYTPPEHIERARRVMKVIDVDPASNDKAQEVVRAGVYYTRTDSGLDKSWRGKVWLNPPYQMPEIKQFMLKLVDEHQGGNATEAIALTTNATDTSWWIAAAEACDCMCLTKGRVRFYKSDAFNDKSSPPNGHCFFYFGDNRQAFVEEFREVGTIVEVVR